MLDLWTTSFILLTSVVFLWIYCNRSKCYDPKVLAVFISGCDSGIGRKLAVHFAEMGCQVYAGCLNPEKARKSLPEEVVVMQLDITKDESVQTVVTDLRSALASKNQNLWALINNAGICVYGLFEWQTTNQRERQVQVNLLGTMKMIHEFIPLLKKSKGRIITVTSINGVIAYPGLSVYCATKFALEGLHNSLRLELRLRYGIRTIVVRPGDYARVTDIMSRHEQHASEMWDAMSPKDKEIDEDFFKRYHRMATENCGLTSPTTFDGSAILKDMVDAVLNEKPRDLYMSAAKVHQVVYMFLLSIPQGWRDWLLKKIVEPVFKSDESAMGTITESTPLTEKNISTNLTKIE